MNWNPAYIRVVSIRIWVATLCMFLAIPRMYAQDPQFTQQFDNPLYLNPALSGSGAKMNRLQIHYRDQWRTVPTPFSTAFISYDRVAWDNGKNSIGAGVQMLYDRAGQGAISTIKAAISPSYTRYLKERDIWVSAGIQLSLLHRFINTDDLIFESQFDGINIGPDSGEELGGSGMAIDLGAGVHAGSRIGSKKHRLEGGFALQNLLKPDLSVVENSGDERPIRYNIYAMSEIFLGNGWSINPIFHFQGQEKSVDAIPLVFARKELPSESDRIMAFRFGAGYRAKDAASMYVGWELNDLKIGLSYDINVSDLSTSSKTVGGPEILVKYEFGERKIKVRPPRDTLPEIDTVQVEEEEEVEIVEEPVIEEDTVTTEIIEEVNAGLAINLYFPNDYPNPGTRDTTTSTTYREVFDHYAGMKQVDPELARFIEEEVVTEWGRYSQLIEDLTGLLKSGKRVSLAIRGYTSPLASSDYNLNLSKRRVESVVNQMKKTPEITSFIESGQLVIIKMPLGETQADEDISDDRDAASISIYSRKASLERRVEIESITIE